MLARESRLNKKSDIVRTIRNGRRIYTPHVLLYVFKPEVLPKKTKVAVVVGKKVSKSAVKRHKYQRWLREIARETIFNKEPCEMVWVALPSLRAASSKKEIFTSLESGLSKIKDF